jgi:hypothetical protein
MENGSGGGGKAGHKRRIEAVVATAEGDLLRRGSVLNVAVVIWKSDRIWLHRGPLPQVESCFTSFTTSPQRTLTVFVSLPLPVCVAVSMPSYPSAASLHCSLCS